MRLVVAEGPVLDEIIDATYPLWNEGLTREGYARWNAAQLKTAWAKDHLCRFALVDDDGRWVASAKRYLWPMRLDGAEGTMCGLGAVFTRPDARGRGYGALIVNELIARAREEGASVAGLFSEIGDRYYGRLGFEVVDTDDAEAEVGGFLMALRLSHGIRARGVGGAAARGFQTARPAQSSDPN